MTYDEEVYTSHFKIRNWYLENFKKYRRELPKAEFTLVKAKLDDVMERANKFHRRRQLKELEHLRLNEAQFFFLPWSTVIWYSQQKKNHK